MSTEGCKVDLFSHDKLLKAIQFSAQQCNAPLSGFIAHCCCSAISPEELDDFSVHTTQSATIESNPVTVDDIRNATLDRVRKTISCPRSYKQAWATRASELGLNLSRWVVDTCLNYVHALVRAELAGHLPDSWMDNTERLEFRLFKLYNLLETRRSKQQLWCEFEDWNTHLFSHLPLMSHELTEELDEMVNRMIQLTAKDNKLMGYSEIDVKLRFYFSAVKRLCRSASTEQELLEHDQMLAKTIAELRSLSSHLVKGKRASGATAAPKPRKERCPLQLNGNIPMGLNAKLERLRVSRILYQMIETAIAGYTQEDLQRRFGNTDSFNRFVFRSIKHGNSSLVDRLLSLRANFYIDHLEGEKGSR